MTTFEGRVAIVTGGNSILGGEIVRAFHREGATVVIAARNVARGRALEEELGDRALFVQTDLTRDEDIVRCVETTSELGGIDVLVNNAAVYTDRGLDSSREEWLQTLDTNLVSGAILVRQVIPEMRKRGGGAIVNIGSVGGKFGASNRALYPASKAALLQLTRNQAMTLAPYQIRVNSVSPGWTWSDPLSQLAREDRSLADRVSGKVQPLGRAGDPREVADAVIFLCSDMATFITGTDLAVDGGFSMLGPDQGRPAREWFESATAPDVGGMGKPSSHA